MNKPIRSVAVFCMLLILALLGNVTYQMFFNGPALSSLSEHPDNRRIVDREFSRDRGAILVEGKPIAESVPSDDRYLYQRRYPNGPMYSTVTGYFTRDSGIGGIEASENSILSGSDQSLFLNRVIDLFGNEAQRGGNVSLTLDAAAQRAAFQGLRGLGAQQKGAVVAIEPSTGKILAMVSQPTYNPNNLATHDFAAAAQTRTRLLRDNDGPLQNRAIENTLPPGSTFKLVTSAAALEDGKTPTSPVDGRASLDLPLTTRNLTNESGGSCGGNTISLQRALEVSCNVSFGALGLELGAERLQTQAEAFGFGETYFDDLNDDLTKQAVSRFRGADPLDEPQTALSAIGQFEVAATPLQMAMVAAGIANSGTVMKPYLVDEQQSPDLDVLSKTDPEPLKTDAISPAKAGQLTDMMVGVVDNGTGTNAQIAGTRVAGKTGTAQSAADRPPYAWFVSFAPADNPKVAVAVLVQTSGTARESISGNGLAAPIARQVMEAVLQ